MWLAAPDPLAALRAGWWGLAALDVSPPGETTGPVILVAGGLAALLIFLLTSVLGSGPNSPKPDEAPRSVRFPQRSPGGSTEPVGPEHAAVAPAPEVPATPGAQTSAPEGDPAGDQAPSGERTGGWLQVMEMGRIAGHDLEVESLEEVLDAAEEAGLGDPEIVERDGAPTTVRLDDCRTCDRGGPPGIDGCPFEAGFLEAGVAQVEDEQVTVLESACRSSGGDACEFEIWH